MTKEEEQKALEAVRQELLERGNELVSFRQLVERFDEIEEVYKGEPWNLEQIYSNFNVLIGKEPCGDCINREDALMCLTGEWTELTDEIIHRFIKRIKGLPSVTPAEKVGHWEWVQYDGNPNIGNWHCSECRTIFIEGTIKKEKDSIPFYKYCPQCGAKMKEGD